MPEIVKTFPIYGNKLEITAERDRYNESRHLFLELAKQARDLFSKKYDEKISSLKMLACNGEEVAVTVYMAAAEQIVKYLTQKKVYSYDVQAIAGDVLSMSNFAEAISPLQEAYEEITDDEAEKDAYRTARRQNRSRYYGFSSYDLTHTVMNKAGAATKNALMGAAHGAFNLAAKGVSLVGSKIKMGSIFNDPNTKESLVTAVFMDVYDAQTAYDKILENNGYGASRFITQKESDESKGIMNSITSNLVPADEIKDQLFNALKSNPYNFSVYEYAIMHYGDEDGGITASADYHHIDINGVKSKFIESLVPEKWENEEHAKKVKERVLLEMKRLSMSESPVLEKINADLAEFDRIARTYKDILFDTREDRAAAVEQDNRLTAMTEGLDNMSRDDSIALKNKIIDLDYVEKIKQLYLDSINAHIFDVENDTAYDLCSPATNYDKQQLKELLGQIDALACCDETKQHYLDLINEQIRQRDDVMLSGICTGVYAADEIALNAMRSKVETSDASAEMKQRYFDIITKRTEDIWSSQDGRVFDDILRNTNVNDAAAIQASIKRISESGRTETKQEYIDALNEFDPKSIKKASWYSVFKAWGFFVTFGIEIILMCALMLISQAISPQSEEAAEASSSSIGPVGFVGVLLFIWIIVHLIFTFGGHNKARWNKMTVNGTAINPAIIPKLARKIKETPRPNADTAAYAQNNETPANASVIPAAVPVIEKAENKYHQENKQ